MHRQTTPVGIGAMLLILLPAVATGQAAARAGRAPDRPFRGRRGRVQPARLRGGAGGVDRRRTQESMVFRLAAEVLRYALVTVVPNQDAETLVRTLPAHFGQIGGLPLLAVFGRPRTIVTKSDPQTGPVLGWNPTFAEVTARLGVAVEVCWPYQPRQKWCLGNLVGWVKAPYSRCVGVWTWTICRCSYGRGTRKLTSSAPAAPPGTFPGKCCARRSWAACDRSNCTRTSWTCAFPYGSARLAW